MATKLNAMVGHAGKRADVKASLQELGLGPEIAEALLLRADWPAAEEAAARP